MARNRRIVRAGALAVVALLSVPLLVVVFVGGDSGRAQSHPAPSSSRSRASSSPAATFVASSFSSRRERVPSHVPVDIPFVRLGDGDGKGEIKNDRDEGGGGADDDDLDIKEDRWR